MSHAGKRAAWAISLAGGLCWAAGMLVGQQGPVLAALACGWLFFAGIAAGAVALGAAIRIAHGKWAGGLLPLADAGVAFFLPSLGVLAVIALASPLWMPEGASPGGALAARDLLAGVALYWTGRRLVTQASAGRAAMSWAIAYLLLYACVLSLWAVDLVMGLRDWAPSTAIPAYYFMGCLVSGLAWVTLVACVRGDAQADANTRHDAGKLLFGLTTFLAYLLWSVFLPTWYANLPDETGQLLDRWQGVFRPLSKLVLACAFFVPFALLLPEQGKRRRAVLGAGATSVLVGLFIERFLLVLPSLELAASVTSVALAAGTVAGVAGLFVWRFTSALAHDLPVPSSPQAGGK